MMLTLQWWEIMIESFNRDRSFQAFPSFGLRLIIVCREVVWLDNSK